MVSEKKILLCKKALTCDNVIIRTLVCISKSGIGMIASKYNVPSTNLGVYEIKHSMWKHFVDTLNKMIFYRF